MKISRETLQTIVNYTKVSSKDETRPFLCSVALRLINEDTLEITACSGYAAIKSEHKVTRTPMSDFVCDKYYLISLRNIKRIKIHLEDKDFNIFNLEVFVDRLTITGRNPLEINLIEREYPRIDSLWPDVKKAPENYEGNEISFSPAKMTDIMKAIAPTKSLQNKIKGLNWILFSKFSAMYCLKEFQGVDHKCVLMPCRM